MSATSRERLGTARLLMVLSSLAPLFVLMAIRGNSIIQEWLYVSVCAALAVVPTLFLFCRVRRARKTMDRVTLTVGGVEDHRNHVLVYLFAMLLPFYREEIATIRDLAAMVVALLFIILLFWRLNLHYMNLFFTILGFQIFSVGPPKDGNRISGKETLMLITKRRHLSSSEEISAYRLSNSVYLETGS